MKVTVNDKVMTLDGPCTVAMLLDQLGLAGAPCAVEVNRDLVPKSRHAGCELTPGDTVEIVTLVGGG